MQAIQFPWDGEQVEIGPLAATVAQMPSCGTVAIGDTHIGIPAAFLRDFLDAYRHLEQYARVRFTLAGERMGVTLEGLRTRAFLKSNLDGAEKGIVRLDLVPADQYRVLLPPTKPELATVNWVRGIVEKQRVGENPHYKHTVLVGNGWLAANNGYQARVARAPASQVWANGAYYIEVKGENIYLNPADVEWGTITQKIIDKALAGQQFRLTVEAIRAAMWKQDHVWVQISDGPHFMTACKPVLSAIKGLKPADVIVFRSRQAKHADPRAYAFGTADRLVVVQPATPNVSPPDIKPVEFPGSDQRVTIIGTSNAGVEKATIITPVYMPPSSPLLVPDLRAA